MGKIKGKQLGILLAWLGLLSLISSSDAREPHALPDTDSSDAAGWTLLHRVRCEGIEFPLEWYSLAAWAQTGGQPSRDALGRVHLPLIRVSEDTWVVEESVLRKRLDLLPPVVPAIAIAPPEAAQLLLEWEPGVEVLSLRSADWLHGAAAPLSRIAMEELAWPEPLQEQRPRDLFPPLELRSVVSVAEADLPLGRLPRARAGLGYFSLRDGRAQFRPRGELRTGGETSSAWLCIAEAQNGRLAFWFED